MVTAKNVRRRGSVKRALKAIVLSLCILAGLMLGAGGSGLDAPVTRAQESQPKPGTLDASSPTQPDGATDQAAGNGAIPLTTCGPDSDYTVTQTGGATIVPGTTDIGNNCDECTTLITLPFAFNLYGQPFTTAIVGSNGTLGFTANGNGFSNYCLPRTTFNNAIFAHWDDLRTDISGTVPSGVFSSTSGSAPNRVFNIEWRAVRFSTGLPANFEVRLYEGQNRFDIIYGSNLDNFGSSATVGVQRGTGAQYTQFSCTTVNGLQPGMQLAFTQAVCPTSTPTSTPTSSQTRTPTATNTPTGTPCGIGSNYVINATPGATMIAGTIDVGNHCDDCLTTIALPFPVTFYGQPYTSVNAGANGNLQFASTNTTFTNLCLPTATFNTSIFPHWDDLRTDLTGTIPSGIFTRVTGAAPNRVFTIEWRAVYFNATGTTVNFEVLFFEGQTFFDIVYGTVPQSGSSATVGVQNGMGASFTQFSCNTSSLSNNLRLRFVYSSGGCPTASATLTRTHTNTPTQTSTATSTSTSTATSTSTRTNTSTPSPLPNCGTERNYLYFQSTGGTINPAGKTRISPDACDDCFLHVIPPFPYLFYGQPITGLGVSENGNVRFTDSATATATPPSGLDARISCLVEATLDNAILAHWEDLSVNTSMCAACGIFSATSGVAPNRVFLIEWRAVRLDSGATTPEVTFEVRLFEGQPRFDIVYGAVAGGGSNAAVGVHGSRDTQFSSFSCESPSLTQGMVLSFNLQACPLFVGHVNWQGRPAQPDIRQQSPITLTLKLGMTEINYPSQSTDSSGFFTVSVGGLANGTYDWRVKGPKYLANGGTTTLLGSPLTSREMGLMRAGDCNGNNVVNAVDFNILRATFGLSAGQPGYDDRADFTGDGVVSSADFNLLRGNFGSGGAPPVGAGESP